MGIRDLRCAELGEGIGHTLNHAAFEIESGGLVREIPDHIAHQQCGSAAVAVVRVNGGDEVKGAGLVPDDKQRRVKVTLPVFGVNRPASGVGVGGLIHALEPLEGIGDDRALLGQGHGVVVIKIPGGEIKTHLQLLAEGALDVFPLGVAEGRLHSRRVGDAAQAEGIAGGLLESFPVKRLPVCIIGAEGLRKGDQGQLLQLGQQRAGGLLLIGEALFILLVFRVAEPDAGELSERRVKNPQLFPVAFKMEAPGPRNLFALLVKADAPVLRAGHGVQPPGLLKDIQAGRTAGAEGPVFLLRLNEIIRRHIQLRKHHLSSKK